MVTRIDRENKFITKSKKKFGGKFDYSMVVYKNQRTPVSLVCEIHGEIEATPKAHLNSSTGCKQCGYLATTTKRKSPLSDVLKKFHKKHGSKYDYSAVEYTNTNTPVKIECPEHGVFSKTPKNHILGQGCPECGNREYLQKKRKDYATGVVEKFKKVHGDKYDYSEVDYITRKTKVKIICNAHGVFEQNPNDHIRGRGCPACGVSSRVKLKTIPVDKVIEQMREVHGGRYDYSLVESDGVDKKVEIICPKHGTFLQTPRSHRRGEGCPTCGHIQQQVSRYRNNYGADDIRDVNGILYLVRIRNKETENEFYKFGITSTTIDYRFARLNSSGFTYEVVECFSDNILNCIEKEKKLEELLHANELLYKIHELRDNKTDGWTECFSCNIPEVLFEKIISRFYR